jgi:hypothetical protein
MVLLQVTLCIVTALAMAVFTVAAVGTSDLTYEAPHFSLSPASMYFLLVCPYILLSTLFSDMILISTLLLFMFFLWRHSTNRV